MQGLRYAGLQSRCISRRTHLPTLNTACENYNRFFGNKATLVAAVAESTGLSKLKANEAVNATLDAITNELANGDKR